MDRELADEILALRLPIVVVGSQAPDFDAFYWEDEQGSRSAVEHLIEQGHSRIGMITSPFDNPVRNARIKGYQDAMEGAGLRYNSSWIATGYTEIQAGCSEESGYEAMQQLLAVEPPVTAVFATSDVQAIGAWQALREAGRSVPEEYALVGYDDIKVSRFIGLTSVAQDMYGVGEAATKLLLKRLSGSTGEVVSRLVSSEVIVRSSS
jgi:LacI family transcriptional regulator